MYTRVHKMQFYLKIKRIIAEPPPDLGGTSFKLVLVRLRVHVYGRIGSPSAIMVI